MTAFRVLYTKATPREYLKRYLDVTTLSLAVHRAIEAKNIARETLKRPVLDIGCGSGDFAKVFFDGRVDVGLDISQPALKNAEKTGKYKKLICADARDLPFDDEVFETVLSVSTLEHIEGVENVVSEVFRVVRPGGKFVFTVNSKRINNLLFWPMILKKCGFKFLVSKYIDLYHNIFKHKSLLTIKKWKFLLSKSGFEVKKVREVLSKEATQHFDKFLITAWPAKLGKIFLGKIWIWRPGFIKKWLVGRYAWLVEKEEKTGSNLFIVAIKPKK